MANVAVYNMEGKEVDKIELNDSIFGVEINEHLVHMAVLQQLANKRQGLPVQNPTSTVCTTWQKKNQLQHIFVILDANMSIMNFLGDSD